MNKLIKQLKQELKEIRQIKADLKEQIQIVESQRIEYESLITSLQKQAPKGVYL